MKEKLEFIRQKEQMNASELAKKLGVEASAISHIKSGRNKPSFDFVVKILSIFPDINPDWLLLDSDEVYRRGELPRSNPLFDIDELDQMSESTSMSKENIELSESKTPIENVALQNFSSAKNSTKPIDKVVILYSDGTFESYGSK